jgi:hypothetical protein
MIEFLLGAIVGALAGALAMYMGLGRVAEKKIEELGDDND